MPDAGVLAFAGLFGTVSVVGVYTGAVGCAVVVVGATVFVTTPAGIVPAGTA